MYTNEEVSAYDNDIIRSEWRVLKISTQDEASSYGMDIGVYIVASIGVCVGYYDDVWYIAQVCEGLPTDDDGEKTAQMICDTHNFHNTMVTAIMGNRR